MVRTTVLPRRPAGAWRLAARAPIWLYRARLGWLLGNRVLMLGHTGRVSGRPRRAVLEVIGRHRDVYLVASGFGHRAQWLANVSCEPRVTVSVAGRTLLATATVLSQDAAAEVLVAYAARHPRLAPRLMAMCGHAVDGSPDSYRRLGDDIPVVALSTRLDHGDESEESKERD
ncbi:nitroreductase family deazaflavin-dependent oxidoreductase [Longispora sp. NPDC051575]|uniref:nitroreductase family deazaflavin-dependent oxidoreductase n=1 Tax=Longispora sp. NPDC051575 TaxID=3154943 RepID=UPI00343E79FF